MNPFVRNPYNYDMAVVSLETASVSDGVSVTIQSQADEADINQIVRRFGVTGELPMAQLPPTLEDFADVFDFQSAMNIIRAAEESFAGMEASVRARFNNDPHLFVNFCQDPENLDELRKLGLANAKPSPIIPPEPQRVVIVNPEVPKGST